MSYSLNVYGHDAPKDAVEKAAREVFAKLREEAGATGGSVSGQGNDGQSISIQFPEPEAAADDETAASSTDEAEPPA